MENNELETSQELDDLRHQYTAMKENLDKQKIINDQIFEMVFKKNMGTIATHKKINLVASLFGLIVIPALGILRKVPASFVISAECLVVFGFVYSCLLYKKYDINKILAYDIRSSITSIKQYRKAFVKFEIIIYTSLFIVILLFLPTIYSSWSTPSKAICAVILSIAIIFPCTYLESIFAKKVLKSCDEILDRLSEIQEKQI